MHSAFTLSLSLFYMSSLSDIRRDAKVRGGWSKLLWKKKKKLYKKLLPLNIESLWDFWPIFYQLGTIFLLAKSRVKLFLLSLLSAAFLLVPQTPRTRTEVTRSRCLDVKQRDCSIISQRQMFLSWVIMAIKSSRVSSDSVHHFNNITRCFFFLLIVSWYRWAHGFLIRLQREWWHNHPPVDMRKFPAAAVESQRLDSNCGPGTTQVDIKTFIKKRVCIKILSKIVSKQVVAFLVCFFICYQGAIVVCHVSKVLPSAVLLTAGNDWKRVVVFSS